MLNVGRKKKVFGLEDFCNCMFMKSSGLTGTRLTFSSSSEHCPTINGGNLEIIFSRVAGAQSV